MIKNRRKKRRPYVSKLHAGTWVDANGKATTKIILHGANGIAAVLSSYQAYNLSDRLIELADTLPEETPPGPTRATPTRQEQACGQLLAHSLTDAAGDPDLDLPSTPAEQE